MPCHILGDIRLDPILVLGGPVEEMRGIGAAHHVDRVNTARLLLVDALIDTLGAGAFDPDGNAGIFRLEGAGQPFRSVELQRGIEAGVAFLFCGLDQRRHHGTRRRRRGFKRLRKNGSRAKSNTGLEHGAARYMLVVHAVPPGCCLPLMGKSDGKSIPAVRAVRSRESEKARFETHPFPSLAGMSASLIGRLGSSTFRLSTTAVSMSLTGSCFSSESAPRPFHYGIRGRGGTICYAALPSD